MGISINPVTQEISIVPTGDARALVIDRVFPVGVGAGKLTYSDSSGNARVAKPDGTEAEATVEGITPFAVSDGATGRVFIFGIFDRISAFAFSNNVPLLLGPGGSIVTAALPAWNYRSIIGVGKGSGKIQITKSRVIQQP